MIITSRVAPDVVALSSAVPGPGGMCFPVNAYCLLGTEPTLVDTGLSPVGEEFRAALWNLVDPGDRVGIGDDVLEAFRPPHYDSPGTLAFHALSRNVCFSSDCFGAFLPADVDLAGTADDVPAPAYDGGMAVFASAVSPWMHDIAPQRWEASVAGMRRRDIGTLLSTHGLPVARGLDRLLDSAAAMPTGPAFVPPGQEFVDLMLETAGAH